MPHQTIERWIKKKEQVQRRRTGVVEKGEAFASGRPFLGHELLAHLSPLGVYNQMQARRMVE